MKRFAIRTIRNGRVRIGGVEFAPREEHRPYDGRLDGRRWAFGLYYTGRERMPFVSLWGSEKLYRGGDDWPGANCVDGVFPWEWWEAAR